MAREPRIQFPGAIYHVIARGDGRRLFFHDEGHNEPFTEGLETEVLRCGWQVISYCWMPNHIHALIKNTRAQSFQRHATLAQWLCELVRQTQPTYGALGSETFLQRLISKASKSGRNAALAKRGRSINPEQVIGLVAKEPGCGLEDYQVFRSKAAGRPMATLL